MSSYMKRLKAFSKRHGVDMRCVTAAQYKACAGDRHGSLGPPLFVDPSWGPFSDAPFTDNLGIYWRAKILIYTKTVEWYEIVHELGHLLATKKDPEDSCEYDFLGWEMKLATQLNRRRGLMDWRKGNRYYIAGSYGDERPIGELSDEAFDVLVDERIEFAIKKGLIRRGRILAVR